ncbi:MAG TPA: hypothetical protein VNM40_04505, partial [Candidatus Paceibacterota bacterium]|nr:hypothetical protein [Candidatus Paceibacterota bacterium]
RAFHQLATEFGLKHGEIGKRIGKSREYVSNTLRILNLPQEMLDALATGEIVEGHTRPLLMLVDRPEQQKTLFQEIVTKRLNVRDSEQIARRIALERARKLDLTPELMLLERELSESLGTRVRIEKAGNGQGKVLIEFFSVDDLAHIREVIGKKQAAQAGADAPETADASKTEIAENPDVAPQAEAPKGEEDAMEMAPEQAQSRKGEAEPDLYSVKNFTV